MHYFKASVLAALVASVSALQVTQPAQMSSIDVSKKNTVQWTTVNTDPQTFSIQLVNMAVNPPFTQNLADNVQASSTSFSFGPLNGITSGNNYQINLVSKTPNNSGILAQSGQFSIVSSGASTTSVSFSSSTPPTSMAGSTSATGTSSGSSSASTTDSSSASGTSSPSSSSSGGFDFGTSTDGASQTAASTSALPSGNVAAGVHVASGLAGLGFVAMVAAIFA